MTLLLLIVIYIAFISLGLPDSVLGAAWAAMYTELGVPVSGAGVLAMIISGGTIVSSLMSGKVVHRLGTGKVVLYSVALTAFALLGFSFSKQYWMLCVLAIPFGLGAGSVDSALNHFVAVHYKSRHMNWLHCFWGIGATVGPIIMSFCLRSGGSWSMGYRTLGLIQLVLVGVLAVSLPLWKRAALQTNELEAKQAKSLSLWHALRLPGAKSLMTAFFCYCGAETTTGTWIASYLVLSHGVSEAVAAQYASLFFAGITVGRLLSGVVSDKVGNMRMVRIGQIIMLYGIAALLVFADTRLIVGGILLFGVGCAPVFPGLLHETPKHFGKENAQTMMGIQMASAYVGTTVMPLTFSGIVHVSGTYLLPYLLLVLVIGLLLFTVLGKWQIKASASETL